MAARAVRRLIGRALPALAAAALATACIQDDGTRFNPLRQFATVSEDDERELGMEFDRALRQHVTVIDDPVVAGFLTDLGQSIVDQIEPQPFVYRFRIVKNPDLNAFAVPGGYIYFHSGTILAAGSIDELAGVMGHEIAHVKARHHARMQEKSQIPDLLAGLAGMAAAVAAEEPGLLVTSQAVNVAVKLRFSREFETEADQLGAVFVTRAGYEPAGIAPFFERLLEQRARFPDNIPPYLFSHPEVEDRLDGVLAAAETLHPQRRHEPDLTGALHEAQARLAMLLDVNRASLPSFAEPADRERSDPLLAEARVRAERGEVDGALLVLARAERIEPNDPRVPFRIGELLDGAGRIEDAAAAYRRTVELDPTRPLVFFKLGRAYAELGERHRAIFAFEQALARAGEGSELQRRAAWEVEKLNFTLIADSGFYAGDDDDMPPARRSAVFAVASPHLSWWAQLGTRFVPHADRMSVRWIDPSGAVSQDEPVERHRKPYVGSTLDRAGLAAAAPGEWTVELRLDEEAVHRDRVRLEEAP